MFAAFKTDNTPRYVLHGQCRGVDLIDRNDRRFGEGYSTSERNTLVPGVPTLRGGVPTLFFGWTPTLAPFVALQVRRTIAKSFHGELVDIRHCCSNLAAQHC